MNLRFRLQVRNRRDVLPRIVMLVHRRGLDVQRVEMLRDSTNSASLRMNLVIAGDSFRPAWIEAHLRNLPDVVDIELTTGPYTEN